MCNNMKVRIYVIKYKDLYNKGINQWYVKDIKI